MQKFLSALVLAVCICSVSFAQESVSGYVTDENGEALIGVGVFVKGSATGGGSITDTKGRYAISVPDIKRDTLVFSYIGMETVEVPVRNRASVDVRMMPSANYLDDVVVIGYGTVRRSDLTGAISSVSSEKILRTPANNVAEALAGKLAGVQVLTTDGAPDAEISMYVRGRNSITQSNAPLYIVDGFPVSSISDIAASDIQSIDVLKDASSTAIYGSRGSNGVIMITTKSAHNNGITVSFNAYLGMKYVAKMPEVLEPYEYALWQYEQSVNRGITESMYDPYFGSFKDIGLYKDYKGNDWQDIVFGRSALVQNYNVALNGRTDKITWSASYTRQEDEAVMITSGYVRDNFTFKFQHRPNRKITLDFQTRYSNTQISGSGANEQNARSVSDLRMRYVMQYSPIPLNGLSAEGMDDDEFYSNSSLFTPTEFIRDNDRRQTDRNITFSGGLTWRIIDNLTFKSNVNYELRKREDKRFFGVTTYYSRMTSTIKDQPAAEMSVTDHNRIINYNTLSYDFKSILPKKHRLNLMIGEEMSIVNSRELTNVIDGFPVTFSSDDAFKFTTQGTAVSTDDYYSTPERLLSFFARANYTYDDRYIFTATVRADGSSKFQQSKPWGFFPSGAFAWRISREPFMQGAGWLSDLKLRLSYGMAGNDNIPSGQTITQYTSETSSFLPFESSSYWTQGQYMTNPDLVWETTVSRDLGLDFGFLNDRISGTLDLYFNTTRDQLIRFPVDGAGYAYQYRNMGTTQNKGLEFTVNTVIIDKQDYGLQFSFNIAMNRNKVIDLGGLDRIEAYAGWASTQIDYDFVVVPGMSMGQIWGYKSDGRYSASDFTWDGSRWVANEGVLDNSYLAGNGWGPGAVKLENLNDDNVITAAGDRTYLGCTLPKATGGFSLSGIIKGFDINANFTYTLGNKILNANKAEYTTTGQYRYQNLLKEMDSSNRWRSIDDMGNRITDTALLDQINANTTLWSPLTGYRFVSSYIVEDGSFLRLNSLTVGYSLPPKVLDKLHIRQLRFYVTGTNLFCLTKYTGFDPEVDTRRSTPMTPGVDYSPYPKTIGFLAGVNFTF